MIDRLSVAIAATNRSGDSLIEIAICYFVATTGNVTDDVIAKYIATHDVEHQDDDKFKVSG